MSQLHTLINCPELQEQLNTYFTMCDPTKLREDLVLQNFLLSPGNGVGGSQKKVGSLTSPGKGKSRQVELVYSPRILESEVDEDTGRDTCTSTNVIGETSETYDVGDNYVQYDFLVDPMELRYKCKDNELIFAEWLQQGIDVLLRKRETKLFTQLDLLRGGFPTDEPGVTLGVKSVKTQYSDGKYNPDMFAQIGTAARYMGYCGNPIVIGGRATGQYFRETAAGCCSASGINVADLAAQYGMGVLESYRADTAFGSTNFFSVAPGAAQLIEWLEFEGPDGINYFDTGVFKQMVITDPSTGARIDMKLNVDCNGKISVFLRSYFKLVALPTDLYSVGDRLAGVNFINEYVIAN